MVDTLIFDASIHSMSTLLFHPSIPGELFSGTILNVILLIKTLLLSQAEFITTFDVSHCAFSEHHMTNVHYMTVNCFCV